jgi:hypothetical protein
MEHLESFIGECDRKVELAKKRLKETQEELSEEASSKVRVGYKIMYWSLNSNRVRLLDILMTYELNTFKCMQIKRDSDFDAHLNKTTP